MSADHEVSALVQLTREEIAMLHGLASDAEDRARRMLHPSSAQMELARGLRTKLYRALYQTYHPEHR